MEQVAPFIKGARWTLTVGAAPFINGCSNLQLQVGAAPFIKGATLQLEPNTPAHIPSTVIAQADKITPVPSFSNEPQLPQQVTKLQNVKKTLTDISRRFSTRILQKKPKKW